MPTNPRLIRPAIARDVPYLYHLQNHLHDCVGYCPLGGLIDRQQHGRLLVVQENDDPAGFLNYTHRRDHRTHISQLAVDPEIWRTTAGTLLMSHIIRSARQAGSDLITLRTAIELDANYLWPTLGFTPQGVVSGQRRQLIAWMLRFSPRTPAPLLPGLRPLPPPLRSRLSLPSAIHPKTP